MNQSADHPPLLSIDTPLVQQLIRAQFPQWAHLPITPVEFNGWDNRTFRLGTEMSVRLPSADRYAQQVEKEHAWLPKLAPHLPLPIPEPLKMGLPAHGYPWHWSIYRWIEGEIAAIAPINDLSECAASLAYFLNALQKIDVNDGPPPGKHNFFRGGSLAVYHQETLDAIEALGNTFDPGTARAVWDSARNADWQRAPVWVHGDVSATNLLIRDGDLSAVIDFGCSAVGDPACDLTVAWTFFSGKSREVFCSTLSADKSAWARARGWALWKALITLAQQVETNPLEAAKSRQIIDAVCSDFDSAH